MPKAASSRCSRADTSFWSWGAASRRTCAACSDPSRALKNSPVPRRMMAGALPRCSSSETTGLLRRRALHRLALLRRARSEFFSTLLELQGRPGLPVEGEPESPGALPHGNVAGEDLGDDPIEPPVPAHLEEAGEERRPEALPLGRIGDEERELAGAA